MGNVSHIVPSIHPYLPIGDVLGHTKEFADASMSDQGMDTLILAAKALAFTGVEALTQPDLLRKIRTEYEQFIKGNSR